MNKTIEKANLRGLPQLYLVEIERATGHRIPAVSPTEVLEAGDVLWFTGVLESVASLRKIPGFSINLYSKSFSKSSLLGLVPHGDQVNKLKRSTQASRLVEAVLAPTSIMVRSCQKWSFHGGSRWARRSEKVDFGLDFTQ